MPKSPKSDDILAAFGQCTRTLIELLHENPRLELVEQMFLESHLVSYSISLRRLEAPKYDPAKIGVHRFLPELHHLSIPPS